MGVVGAEGWGDFDFGVFEDADEFEGVDDGFAEVMVVGDDEDAAGAFGDALDAFGPGLQFFLGVQVVVALVLRELGVVAEPGVVAASVEANVADRGSDFGGRRKRFADDGLVDVADAGVEFAEQVENLRRVPGTVADFDDQGIVGEALQDGFEVCLGFRFAVEGKRELEEDGAEFAGLAESVETGADSFFVFERGGRIVREFPPQFGGEDEIGICGNALDPASGVVGAERLVKRSVDFDGVEELREISGFVEAFGFARGIDVAVPIGVRPARGADAEIGCHPSGFGGLRIAGRFPWSVLGH